MELVDHNRAAGLSVVLVMLDRIMELPDEVRNTFTRQHGMAPRQRALAAVCH
jgi:hypothetical protein